MPGRAVRGGGAERVIESARQQWADGAARLREEAVDAERYRQLCDLVDAVVAELRRRVGQRYTVAELARAHAASDDWVRELVLDATGPRARVSVRDAALVQDAAFAAYARGARDWRP